MLRRLSLGDPRDKTFDTRRVLGTVGLGVAPPTAVRGTSPALQIPLEQLGPRRSLVDVWYGDGPVRVHHLHGVDLATDGRVLFGFLQVDEQAAGGLRAAARAAYASIFDALDQSGFAHPLRFWNYVPRINAPLDGLERYRHFNIGRQEAFLGAGRAAFAGAPAACAIGTEAQALLVCFLAAGAAPTSIENPRQVSAYDYPADYGPRSPTFSRATLTAGDPSTLLISGTASVVGHRSEHPGDAAAQTRETFLNLRAVVDGANAKLAAPTHAIDRLIYTVYVRHAADFDAIFREFATAVGTHSDAARSATFLRADICRAELLVEIEATGSAA